MICRIKGNFRAGWADTRPRRQAFREKVSINKQILSASGRFRAPLGPPVGRERIKKNGAFSPVAGFAPAPGRTTAVQPREATPCRNRPCSRNGQTDRAQQGTFLPVTRSPRSSPAAKRPLPNCCRPLSGAALGLPPPGAGVRPHRRRRPGIPERRVRRLGAGAARRPAAGGREHGAIECSRSAGPTVAAADRFLPEERQLLQAIAGQVSLMIGIRLANERRASWRTSCAADRLAKVGQLTAGGPTS